MDLPVKVRENVNEISFTRHQAPGGNQKAENSEKKCRFFFLSENKKTDVVNAHNQDAAKQKEVDIKGALSDLPHILRQAQQNRFPGPAFAVMKI